MPLISLTHQTIDKSIAALPPRTWDEHIPIELSPSCFTQGGQPEAPQTARIRFSTFVSKGGGKKPLLRAWDEHIPIVRIIRNFLIASPRAYSLGGLRTARVQRGLSGAARCASMEATQVARPSSLLAAAPLRLIKESVGIQRRQAAIHPLSRRYPVTTRERHVPAG